MAEAKYGRIAASLYRELGLHHCVERVEVETTAGPRVDGRSTSRRTEGEPPGKEFQIQEREAERARITAEIRQHDLLEQARTLDVRQIAAELNGRLVD